MTYATSIIIILAAYLAVSSAAIVFAVTYGG